MNGERYFGRTVPVSSQGKINERIGFWRHPDLRRIEVRVPHFPCNAYNLAECSDVALDPFVVRIGNNVEDPSSIVAFLGPEGKYNGARTCRIRVGIGFLLRLVVSTANPARLPSDPYPLHYPIFRIVDRVAQGLGLNLRLSLIAYLFLPLNDDVPVGLQCRRYDRRRIKVCFHSGQFN